MSTLHAHEVTVASRAQQHEVVNQNTVWATGLFDHGRLLGGVWSKSSLILRPNCEKRCMTTILRSTSFTWARIGRGWIGTGSMSVMGIYRQLGFMALLGEATLGHEGPLLRKHSAPGEGTPGISGWSRTLPPGARRAVRTASLPPKTARSPRKPNWRHRSRQGDRVFKSDPVPRIPYLP